MSGAGVSGAALATGMRIAADATPPSRPPAMMPYRPRRTVVADIFIKSLLLCATRLSHPRGFTDRHLAKRSRPWVKALRRTVVPGQSAIRPEEKICLAALAGDRFAAFLFAFDLECDVDELVFLAADELALPGAVQ